MYRDRRILSEGTQVSTKRNGSKHWRYFLLGLVGRQIFSTIDSDRTGIYLSKKWLFFY